MAKLQNAEKLTDGNYFPDVFSLAFSAFGFFGNLFASIRGSCLV